MTTRDEFRDSEMTCGHCEKSVREETQNVPGVTEVNVSHESGKLLVTSMIGIEPEVVTNAVEEAGYQSVPA